MRFHPSLFRGLKFSTTKSVTKPSALALVTSYSIRMNKSLIFDRLIEASVWDARGLNKGNHNCGVVWISDLKDGAYFEFYEI